MTSPPGTSSPRQPFPPFLAGAVRGFAADRSLLLTWFAYLLWYTSLGITPNLALHTRQAMGADPKECSGYMMAIRFACKSAGGLLLGMLAVRHGIRAGAIASVLLLAAASGWAWLVPGSAYLFRFGLIGAGELGGSYFSQLCQLAFINGPAGLAT
jgi:MFS family permease